MPKTRVHEIAKQLNINSKEIIDKLKETGKEVKNLSTLEEDELKIVKEFFKAGEKVKSPQQSQAVKPSRPKQPVKDEQPTKHEQSTITEAKHEQSARRGQYNQQAKREQRNQPIKREHHNQQAKREYSEKQDQPRSDRREQVGAPHQQVKSEYYKSKRPAAKYGQRPGQSNNSGEQSKPEQTPQQRKNYDVRRKEGTQKPYERSAPRNTDRPDQGQAPRSNQKYTQRSSSPSSEARSSSNTGQKPAYRSSQGQAPKQNQQSANTDRAKPRNTRKPFDKHSSQAGSRMEGKQPQEHKTSSTPERKPKQRSLEKAKPVHKSSNRHNKQQKVVEVPQPKLKVQELEDGVKVLQIPKSIVVKDLAEMLNVPASDVIMQLMKRGFMTNVNQEIEYYVAAQIADHYDFLTEKVEEVDLLEQAFADDDKDKDALERPPVVVVMGHVDHGKTSLLDAIRKSNVISSEAGGITQHIGAYTVSIDGKPITFLDTPGHEAFTAMRMRGAKVTDIAVLVVAADDGVMPQTIEAINHARAANIEIIVAINKIDKPSANQDRVKQELVEFGLLAEDWGGETICVPVSAMNNIGIDQLLEMIILVAELKELKANPKKKARGTVIEALLDKGRGSVATVLVQNGTLEIGDPIIAGSTYGKVRAMMDYKGRKVKKAGPSMPVEILGLPEVPLAGDMFYVANNEKHARQIAESIIAKGREDMLKSMPKVSLDDLFNQIQSGNVKDLNIVVKADVQGSVEALKNSLERLSNEEVRIRTIHGGVGAITESDVMLASASNAIVIGFNVRPEATAKSVADNENVDIRLYRIIYNAIEDITAAMKGLLEPIYQEKTIGHAEIRQLFKASGVGTIGGSYITDGKFVRNAKVRIYRDNTLVYEGTLDTLKRFKDDVKEVNSGYECGLLFNKFNDIKEGDKVEAYIMEAIPR